MAALEANVSEMHEAKMPRVPASFKCPITHRRMKDPVMTSDGYTFERRAIERWFARERTSPLTGKPVSSKQLIPNRLIKTMIAEFLEDSHP